MSHYISKIYDFYSESEVQYFSYLRVDNDTIQLPSQPTFDVQENFLHCQMSLQPINVMDLESDCLSVENDDSEAHIIAYKFEVIAPKKDGIFLTNYGLKNGTKSISFESSMIGEVNTYSINDDYIIDMIFYPKYTESHMTGSFQFILNTVDFRDSVFTKQIYNQTQYRGTKEMNFICEFDQQNLYPLIFYFDFEKPFFRINPYNNTGYLIPISFLESGNCSFTVVTRKYNSHPTHNLSIIDPPQIKIENNTLEKQDYYKTTDHSIKLIYDIEFPSNVLYSINYYFDDNKDDKLTEYLYNSNYKEHFEHGISLPSTLNASNHILQYFFNATGLITETFESQFSLLYHKPVIHLITDNDENNPPIFIRAVNDSFNLDFSIKDEDPNDNVTCVIYTESSTIIYKQSHVAPYYVYSYPDLGNKLHEGGQRIKINAIDQYGCSASKSVYFYFVYKYNKPEIEFQSENNISMIDNFVRIRCKVRDYRKHGKLTIEANMTNEFYNYNKKREISIYDDSFKDVNIDIPIDIYYEGEFNISLFVSNEYDETSSIITKVFNLEEIPTINIFDKNKKLLGPNKYIPFIYSLISIK